MARSVAFDASGSRHYDKTLEEEANWLGPALLISDEATIHIATETGRRATNALGAHAGGTIIAPRISIDDSTIISVGEGGGE